MSSALIPRGLTDEEPGSCPSEDPDINFLADESDPDL